VKSEVVTPSAGSGEQRREQQARPVRRRHRIGGCQPAAARLRRSRTSGASYWDSWALRRNLVAPPTTATSARARAFAATMNRTRRPAPRNRLALGSRAAFALACTIRIRKRSALRTARTHVAPYRRPPKRAHPSLVALGNLAASRMRNYLARRIWTKPNAGVGAAGGKT
jgi:hypothetical protein